MYLASKEYHFSAAHRLDGHPKCGRMHGHNYKIVVVIGCWHLHDGMVLDFGELNKIIEPIIEDLDHRYLLAIGQSTDGLKKQETFPMNIPHTTAECIAKWLSLVIDSKLPSGRTIEEVQVWETPKAVGTYRVHPRWHTSEE